MTQRLIAEGHLIDSGILTNILNLIIEEGEDYNIVRFEVGKTNAQSSRLEIDLISSTSARLKEVSKKLINIGCYEAGPPTAVWKAAPKEACVPEDFYSTTQPSNRGVGRGELAFSCRPANGRGDRTLRRCPPLPETARYPRRRPDPLRRRGGPRLSAPTRQGGRSLRLHEQRGLIRTQRRVGSPKACRGVSDGAGRGREDCRRRRARWSSIPEEREPWRL